jgi:hypothetical protein
MFKLIAIDMDDTILNRDLLIMEKTLLKINEAKKLGVKIVLSSGRSSKSMLSYIHKHRFDEFFISFNGALLTNANSNEILFDKKVEQKYVHQLVDISREYNINMQMYYKDNIYVEKYNEKTMRYEKLSGIEAKLVDDLKRVPFTGSIKVLFNHNHEELFKLKPLVEERFGDNLNIFFSKPHYLEFLNKEANKGLALMALARHLNINANEIIAIGDSFNDVSMIEYAGIGVAMANAHPLVKQKANYVTSKDHNNDGVAEVIDKYILKN